MTGHPYPVVTLPSNVIPRLDPMRRTGGIHDTLQAPWAPRFLGPMGPSRGATRLKSTVIPAQAGILYRWLPGEIPASAGMTSRLAGMTSRLAGMTSRLSEETA